MFSMLSIMLQVVMWGAGLGALWEMSQGRTQRIKILAGAAGSAFLFNSALNFIESYNAPPEPSEEERVDEMDLESSSPSHPILSKQEVSISPITPAPHLLFRDSESL